MLFPRKDLHIMSKYSKMLCQLSNIDILSSSVFSTNSTDRRSMFTNYGDIHDSSCLIDGNTTDEDALTSLRTWFQFSTNRLIENRSSAVFLAFIPHLLARSGKRISSLLTSMRSSVRVERKPLFSFSTTVTSSVVASPMIGIPTIIASRMESPKLVYLMGLKK